MPSPFLDVPLFLSALPTAPLARVTDKQSGRRGLGQRRSNHGYDNCGNNQQPQVRFASRFDIEAA